MVGLRERRYEGSQTTAAVLAARLVKPRRTSAALGLSLIFEGTARWHSAASSVDASGIAALAYVVVVSTFFGYGVWYWLLSRHPASTVAPFTLLVPVVGILTAWLVRGEHPTWGELLGSLVVLVGLALALGVVDTLAARRAFYSRLDVRN
jgi:O-acetylserine/cysteine efflux transporter